MIKNIFIKDNISGFIGLGIIFIITSVVIYWRTSVEEIPGDYHVRKGNYRLEDGEYESAVKEFMYALKKNPMHPFAHLGLAITYMQMDKLDMALKHFNITIKLNPELGVAYANRGILYDRMGSYKMAFKDYKKALEIDPKLGQGPGWLWCFLHNIKKRPPTIADRAAYIEAEMKKVPEKRILQVKEIDEKQRMFKVVR